jgi:hypothetical protein
VRRTASDDNRRETRAFYIVNPPEDDKTELDGRKKVAGKLLRRGEKFADVIFPSFALDDEAKSHQAILNELVEVKGKFRSMRGRIYCSTSQRNH